MPALTPDGPVRSALGELPSRRALLRTSAARAAGAGAATALVSACSPAPGQTAPAASAATTSTTTPATTATSPRRAQEDSTAAPRSNRTLLAYFSRPGENYHHGGRIDLTVGNTEALAGMIVDLIDCDVVRVQAADPYPASYDATRDRNVAEQDADARPPLATALPTALPDMDGYDTVLVGSPIWNVRPPMLMATFTQALDLTATTVHPFVTYAVSGLGSAPRDYASWCPGAQIGEGLAVRGEDLTDAPDQAGGQAQAWLRSIGLL